MKKNNLLRNSGVQSLLASLMCILVGLLAGYIALLINQVGSVQSLGEMVGASGMIIYWSRFIFNSNDGF